MRESCRIVKETLDFVGKNIKAGMTTKDVDDLVYRYITSCGGTPSSLGYEGFPASACVSVNDVVVHGIPSDDVILVDGDIVSVDITVEKNGYNGVKLGNMQLYTMLRAAGEYGENLADFLLKVCFHKEKGKLPLDTEDYAIYRMTPQS